MTLLAKIEYALNKIPNKKNVGPNGESSYELVEELSRYLEPRYFLLGESVVHQYMTYGIDGINYDHPSVIDAGEPVKFGPREDDFWDLGWMLDGFFEWMEINKDEYEVAIDKWNKHIRGENLKY